MEFSIDWEGGDRSSDDIDLLAAGALRVLVDRANVCEFRESWDGKTGEALPVSVYPLAEGVATGWWRLFGGRDAQFRAAVHRGGYAMPDIRLEFDGVGFEVSCRPRRYENPPVYFPNGAVEWLERKDAERALGAFLAGVIGRLEERGVRDSGLQQQWRLVQASREDPEEAAFCEAAGALGLDAYDMSDADAAFIEDSRALFDGEALAEFLSGLRRVHGRKAAVESIRQLESRPRYKSRLPGIESLRAAAPGDSGAEKRKPWEAGYRWAREARRMLDAPQSERFRSVTVLARRLGATGFKLAPLAPGVSALVETVHDEARVHLRRFGNQFGNQPVRLFAFARAIGDAVANPPTRRSAVNSLRHASRQACGRAFAAEFLAPIDEILSMRNDGLDTDAVADEFGVSAELVERQEENADRIREACA